MEKQKNIPTLRFPEFKKIWNLKKFGNVYSFKTTNSLSRDKLNYLEGYVKNIHYGDIHTKFNTHFHINKEIVPFINSEIPLSKFPEDYYCKESDLIIADASEDYLDIGKSIEIVDLKNEKVLAGLHTFIARPDSNEIVCGFGGHLMKSPNIRSQIQKIAQGTKVLSISTGRLSNIQITLPSLPEQQKIAAFLTSVDERIAQLTKKKTLLEQYKKGVMQKIFSQEIRFKDDNGKEFVEWRAIKLKDIATNYYQGINTTADEVKYHKKGIPILQAKHISDEVLSFSDARFVSDSDYAKYRSKYKPNIDDILISNIGTLGKVVLIEQDIDLLIAWNIFKVSINSNLCLPKYIMYSLKKIGSDGYFKSFQTGNATKFVNKNEMLLIPIYLPCIEEQIKIANFLSAIDKKNEGVDKQLEQTKRWKKGLLQQMFC